MKEMETQQSTGNFAAVGFSLVFPFLVPPSLPRRLLPSRDALESLLEILVAKKLVRTFAIYKLTFVALLGSDGVSIGVVLKITVTRL